MRNRHSGPQPPVETWEKTGCVQFYKKLRPRVIYSMGVHDVGHYFMVRLHFGATEGGAAAQCNEERHRAGHPIIAHYTVCVRLWYGYFLIKQPTASIHPAGGKVTPNRSTSDRWAWTEGAAGSVGVGIKFNSMSPMSRTYIYVHVVYMYIHIYCIYKYICKT